MTTQISVITPAALLRDQLRAAHQLMEATMSDVTAAQAHVVPPGIANPLGATYAHAVTSEDYIVQGMFKQSAPLAVTGWAGKTGLSEPMPMPGPQWAEYAGWTRRVTIDLDATRAYAQAVYATTDAYIATLSDADIARPIDLSAVGMGEQTVASALALLVVNHMAMMTGEVSCLKGLQGQRGYPM